MLVFQGDAVIHNQYHYQGQQVEYFAGGELKIPKFRNSIRAN